MTPPRAEKPDPLNGSLDHLGRNWVWDMKSDRVYASEEVAVLYGIDPGTFDWRGSSIAKLVHPEDAAKRKRAIADARQGKKVEPFEYRVLRADGTQRVVLVKEIEVHTGADGEPLYMAGAIQDITELKVLQEQLSLLSGDLERRVHERTAELERVNTRLKELDRLKSMFIALTSHEFRTPLNSILGFISMTLHGLSGALNEEQKDNLARAHGSALHLASLVNEVIDIAKIEAGKTEASPEAVTLLEVVADAAAAVEPQRLAKGLGMEVHVPAGVALFTDRKRLLQCLINLLGNAVKFTERGGIAITATEKGAVLDVAISDTGIGMAEDDLPRLFQPFERLESRMRVKTGGTGLGLYLTRKLCREILRGEIAVQSREGEGSCFTLTIAKDISTAAQQEGEGG